MHFSLKNIIYKNYIYIKGTIGKKVYTKDPINNGNIEGTNMLNLFGIVVGSIEFFFSFVASYYFTLLDEKISHNIRTFTLDVGFDFCWFVVFGYQGGVWIINFHNS